MLFCVLLKPTAARAYETGLRIMLYDADTKEQIVPRAGDLSYAAHVKKVNGDSASYEYDATQSYSYGYYHSKSYVISPNTYEALGWVVEGGSNSISIPHMLMDRYAFTASTVGLYDVAIRVPSDYQGFGSGSLSLREFLNMHNYEAKLPTTAMVEKENNEYVLKVYAKKRSTHSIKFQIDNLQQLTSAGYSFKLKYEPSADAGKQLGPNAQTISLTQVDNTLHLVDVRRPELGHYALIVVDPSGNESVASEFMLEPLRIPRVGPSQTLPGGMARYGLFIQPWSTWKSYVGADDSDRMMRALDAHKAAYKNTDKMTSQLIEVENKWTRVRLIGGSASVSEVFPSDPADYYVGHTLNVDLNLKTLTIKKGWLSTDQRPESVVVDYQADGGQTNSVTLNQANNWSSVVAIPSNAAITFTEKNPAQNYKPAGWVLNGLTNGGETQTMIALPTSQDGDVARLDLVNGTGVDGGQGMSVEEQKLAKTILDSDAPILFLSNQKAKTFNVEKQWDIDEAKTDKPASIVVALQERDDAAKKWVTVLKRELSEANGWKASLWIPDYGQAANTYRVRELSSTNQTVWAQNDLDAPAIKSVLEGLDDWNDIWTRTGDLNDFASIQPLLTLFTGSRVNYVPTVVYNVGDHQTKYYATYSVDANTNTTTIKDTAVLDVSIYKRWLMFGDAQKPSSVNLALMGRDMPSSSTPAPYALVTDALYGDATDKTAIATARESSDSGKSWCVQFGVRKYSAEGIEQEYLGAESVNGVTQLADDSLPVTISSNTPRYFTLFGRAYKAPAVNADYERTANVINTWLSPDSSGSVGRTIGGTKIWDDNNDAAGKRPSQITLHVYAALDEGITEVTGSPVTVRASDGWVWSLSLSNSDASKDKTLYVEEEIPDGYEATFLSTYDICNTYKADATDRVHKTGKVVWDDDNDVTKRPPSVRVRIKADGQEVDSRIVTKDNDWTWSFPNLPKQKDGKDITYTVEEDPVPDYGISVDNPRNTITNRYLNKHIDINVTKVWDDNNNADGNRQSTVTVRLLADGEAIRHTILTASEGWSGVFKDLPTYSDGKEITYSVEEDTPPEYVSSVTGDAQTGFTITNTYHPTTTNIKVKKVWEDSNNANNTRPESVTVRLRADGANTGKTLTLNANNNWEGTLEAPRFWRLKAREYTVTEDAVDGYKQQITGDAESGFVVTNTYINENVHIRGSKVWDDDDNRDGKRPTSITVKLLADGVQKEETTVTAANGWAWDFGERPKYKDGGGQITYTVAEDQVPDYEAPKITGTAQTGFTITNTHVPETVNEVSGTKTWNDNGNEDKRPEYITVRLYGDGVELDDDEVSAKNSWSWSFNGLPKNDNGKPITYTISEDAVDGYTTTIDGYNVTNTYNSQNPDTTSVSVRKVWDDDDNATTPHDSVTVKLLANGAETDQTAQLNDGNKWSAVFSSLPKQQDGQDITYTVIEDPVPDGYTSEVEGNATEGFTITNTYKVQTTSVSVTKEWDDNDNSQNKRPDSVIVQLKADGESAKDENDQEITAELNADGNWTHTFENLPKYKANDPNSSGDSDDSSEEIEYTVAEVEVNGYTTKVSGSAAEGFTLTNTYDFDKYEVEKVWDIDKPLGKDRPDSIVVALQKLEEPQGEDGEGENAQAKDPTWKTVATAELSEGNSWKAELVPPEEQNGGDEQGSEQGGDQGDAQGGEQKKPTYRIRELKGDKDSDPVWAKTDSDAKTTKSLAQILRDPNTWANVNEGKLSDDSKALLNQIKDAAKKIDTWVDFWKNGVDQKKLDELLTITTDETYEPTVTYETNDGETKYYATYKTEGNKTTITNTAVLDVSIWKRWLMFGGAKKPDSVLLMLFGRSKMDGGEQEAPYLPVYDALYGDKKNAADLADMIGIKDTLLKIPGVDEDKINEYFKVGLALQKVKADEENPDSLLKGWNAHFGVRKYDATGHEREYLGAEMVTGLMKIGADTLTGKDFPVMLQPIPPMYFTVFGKAYKIPVVDANYERTSNVINTWLKLNFEIGRGIGGTKIWDDDGNAAGKRPSTVTLHVYAKQDDGSKQEVTGSPITVKESDGWVWSLAIPKGDPSEGKELSLEEEVPDGYSVTYDGCDVFNKMDGTSTLTIKGKKTWEDENNKDGKRPSSIKIRLLADGVEKESRTVTASNGWSWAFSNLPKQVNGNDIKYTIKEDAVTDYTTKVSGYNVTNTYKGTAKTRIQGKKTWNDNNDAAGKRPKSITVRLRANGTVVSYRETSAADGWKWDFGEMPRYQDGKQISYTLTEDAVDGYTSSVSGYDVTNTYNSQKPETTSVSVSKTWDDDNNAAKKRPQSVTVHLHADGTDTGKKATLSAQGGWSHTFSGLDKKNSGGKEIAYTVTEDQVPEYTTKITGTAQTGFTITNTNRSTTVTISGTKIWNDSGNESKRPKKITIRLLANNVEVDSKEVSEAADKTWKWTFDNKPSAKDGRQINYTVTEDAVDGYTTEITGTAQTGFTITNTYNSQNPESTSVGVRKVWVDGSAATQHDGVTVKLLANGADANQTVTLDANNNWSATFSNLDKQQDGKDIVYTVAEDTVPNGYACEITGNATGGFTITNTYTPATVIISGIKTWEDNNNTEGKRPEKITIRLLADNVEVDYKEVSAADNGTSWAWSFENKPATKDGRQINYTVTEDAVDGYTTEITGTVQDGFTITNTYNPTKTSVSVRKVWDDDNNAANTRPQNVTVHLRANGEATGDPVTLSAQDGWSHTFSDLAKKGSDGKDITYTVTEDAVPDYTTEVTGTAQNGFTITNTYKPAIISVNKVWEDSDDADGLRPDFVTVHLVDEGDAGSTADDTIVDSCYITEDDDWQWVFDDLPTDNVDDYNIMEDAVPGYTTETTGTAQDGFTITNTREAQKTSLRVRKEWDDQGIQGRYHPPVTVHLLKSTNGEVEDTGKTLVLSENNEWVDDFENLLANEDGEPITYSVREDTPIAYTSEVEHEEDANGTPTCVITNTLKLLNVVVTQEWEDYDDLDGIRPKSVILELSKGKDAKLEEIEESSWWVREFDDLPVYDNNMEKINYSVTQANTPEGYSEAKVERQEEEDFIGYVLTNEHVPGSVSIRGRKVWDDNDNEENLRPSEVTIRLYVMFKEGDDTIKMEVDSTKASEATGWKWHFDDLLERAYDYEYTYSVEEDPVDGYATEVDLDESTGEYVITNTLQSSITVAGKKTWLDDDDAYGKRPESLRVYLLANHEIVGQTTISAEDEWMYEFVDLPKERDGEDAVYSVVEEQLDDYEGARDGYDLYNAVEEEYVTTTISGRKVWDDNDDAEHKRPTSVVVYLLANGVVVDSTEATAQDDWKWEFKDVPAYEHGEPIIYSVAEGRVEDYALTVEQPSSTEFVLTNTLDTTPPEGDVSVEGHKTWDDDDDAAGLRPESILVHLLADNMLMDTHTATGDDWAWTFEHLPQFADTPPYGYRIVESKVNNYLTTYDGLDVVNTLHTAHDEKVTVHGKKVWDDNDDAAGKRPQSIEVYLVANDAEIVGSRTVTAEDDWSWEFADLPKYEDEQEIAYSIIEGDVEGYTATVEGDMAEGFVVTNSLPDASKMVAVEGAKTWDDNDNALGLRPNQIVIQLLANDKPLYKKVVSEEDGWKWRFAGLPAQEDGKDIVYTIAEDAVEGYVATVDGYNVTNKAIEPTRHDPPVTKVVTGDTPPSPSDFTFVLTPNDEAFPMPNDKTGGTATVTITGSGSSEFGWITFTKPGTYEYTVTETDTGVVGYTYDTSVYVIRYDVVERDGKLEATRTFFKDGQVVEGLEAPTFTNVYRVSPEPTTPTTPTTPATPAASTTSQQHVPATGDPTSAVLPAVLLVLGMLALAAAKVI